MARPCPWPPTSWASLCVAWPTSARGARPVWWTCRRTGASFPPFLIENGGLNSGFMMVQYTSAALASENKSLAHPASVDTIPTSANTEDHVSMGPIAARHARAIVANTARVLALEAMMAAQAIDFRLRKDPSARLGAGTRAAYDLIRSRIPFLERDEDMQPHIASAIALVTSGELARVLTVQPEAPAVESVVSRNSQPSTNIHLRNRYR